MKVIDLKRFLAKHIKNPILIAALAFLIWRILKKHLRQAESINESYVIIKTKKDKQLVFDKDLKKYLVFNGTNYKVFSDKAMALLNFNEKTDLKELQKELVSLVNNKYKTNNKGAFLR